MEAAATGVLQESVPDEVRATILGLNDSIIIAAALVGALAAPALVEVTGGRVVFALLAVLTLLVAWWARPLDGDLAHPDVEPGARARRRQRHQVTATVWIIPGEGHVQEHHQTRIAHRDRDDARRARVRPRGLLCCRRDSAPGTSSKHGSDSVAVGKTPEPATYVALGDSYTAPPLVPVTDMADGCFRSSGNYPALAAKALGFQLEDRSCAGARTASFDLGQGPGIPAQKTALQADTDLVTVGLGGNDGNVFGTLIRRCTSLRTQDPSGAPCEAAMASAGKDGMLPRLTQTRRHLTAVAREVHRLSPKAKVLLVGYPQIVDADHVCRSCRSPQVTTPTPNA